VNLLDNALKFTDAPGQVVLRAGAEPAVVRFSIANSGPALAAEEREAMFRPFWQAGPEDRRGAGLGLSICRSIIETHGGRIWAEPEPGKRVRICFELPRATAATMAKMDVVQSSLERSAEPRWLHGRTREQIRPERHVR
jgi:signal transduction histidine kinase